MTIQQLSVFLENKSGRLLEVTKVLGENNINMSAFSIADTSDFGMLRMIVDQPEAAFAALKKQNFSVSITPVVDEDGTLSVSGSTLTCRVTSCSDITRINTLTAIAYGISGSTLTLTWTEGGVVYTETFIRA